MKNRFLTIIIVTFLLIYGKITFGQQNVETKSIDSQKRNTKDEKNPAFQNAKKAKIIIHQFYGSADKVSLPFKETIERILKYSGITVDTLSFDMIITIDAIGSAISENYSGKISGTQYTGASLKGTMRFENLSGESFTEQFDETEPPPKTIFMSFNSSNNAPFGFAFNKLLPTILNKSIYNLLGITPVLASIKDQDVWVRSAAAEVLGDLKDSRSVEPLCIALKDQSYYVRIAAAVALGKIKDKRSIEPLMAGLKYQDSDTRKATADALKKITGNDFGEDYTLWQEWWGGNK